MTEQKEKVFVDGLISKKNQNAPDFVVVNQSFKVEEFITFLKANASSEFMVKSFDFVCTEKMQTKMEF